ncbi:MAG: alpha-L-fucosidase, partial [Myxococcota bacterium]|nr:alpha-L-fucosidase [Myxococcota bacterium]
PPRPPFCDVRTPEYAVFPDVRRDKWESVRGMDKSFGYNRASRPEDFLSREDLLQGFADIVSKNGNLLLNVGPRGEDAAIPEPQRERLRWLGSFLARAGEAVYGTRPWRRAEGRTDGGLPVRFTAKGDDVFALVLGTPAPPGAVRLPDAPVAGLREVELLGHGSLDHAVQGGGLEIASGAPWPEAPVQALALRGAGREEGS